MQRLQERLEQRAAEEAEAAKKRAAAAAASASAADAPIRTQARPLRHHKPRAAMGWRGTNMYALGDEPRFEPHLETTSFPSGFPLGLINPPYTRTPRPPGAAPPLPFISPSPRAARLVTRNEKPHDARVGTTVLDGIVVRVDLRAQGGVGGGRREAERRRELAGEPRTPGGRRRVQWWSTRRAPGDEAEMAEMAAAKKAAAAYTVIQEARTLASLVIQRYVRGRHKRRNWPFACRRFVDVVAHAEQQREREDHSLIRLDAAARCVQRAERRRHTIHDVNLFTARCRTIAADLALALEPLALMGRRLEVKAAVRLQRWWRSQRRSERLRRAVQAALKLQRGLRRASQTKRAKRERERRGRGATTTRVDTKRATRHSPLGGRATRLSRSPTPSVKVH